VIGPSSREYIFFLIAPGVPIRNLLRAIGVDALLGLAGVLSVAGVFCFWLARHITAPVLQLSEAASQIADGRISTRVPPAMHARRDEIGLLGQHFDRMAGRIESLVAGQRRLLSTVSHELRSPLTRLSCCQSASHVFSRGKCGIPGQDRTRNRATRQIDRPTTYALANRERC
jgi:two-component system, OmpR family, sensor histidine kinase CpxA